MSKQQQSQSKTAYRGFVGFSAKIILFSQGRKVETPEDMQNLLTEAEAELRDEAGEFYSAVLFSRTRSTDLWQGRFEERIGYALDKIREQAERQLERSYDEAEAEFERAAAAFGTDVETYAEFLQWDKPGITSSESGDRERKTAYTDLGDVLNVFTKISFAVIYVRYWQGFYYIAVGDSGGGRRKSRRKSRQKKSKKTVRF